MNITELARRLRVTPEELRQKLPELGFAIGRHAIKIDTRQAQSITEKWNELQRRERLTQKVEAQKAQSVERDRSREIAKTRSVDIPPVITVRDFATRLELPVPRVMQELMKNGILASLNERIDFDTASIIAEDLGFTAIRVEKEGKQEDGAAVDRIREAVENATAETLKPRAPVVVIMGHVDHGKTRLLDAIRNTHVMEGEAGGITQHIGAYQVERQGRKLTFIDTPGHEAFTVMRSRGAKVADIAILVVAADDGVQPQTKEAINIIQSAKLPFIVALNKIDKPDANVDRVKGELAELKLVPEDWGGTTIVAPISAKAGIGIDALLDTLILVADLHKDQIVSNPDSLALGTMIESHVDPAAGPVATVLVQSGTLHVGDTLGVRGNLFGRVRAMEDWNGDAILEAPPSTPAKILGWKLAPAVGDIMEVPKDPKSLAKIKSTDISVKATEEVAAIKHLVKAETPESAAQHVLNLVIRADVLGSLEAMLGMLDKIQHPDVAVKVVQKGLGNVTDSDVATAAATGAFVVGFNVQVTPMAEELARDKKVSIKSYQVIYRFFDDVMTDLEKLLPSEMIITELGTAEVLANFRKLEGSWIIGVKVKEGKLTPKAKLRLKRGEEYVGEGEIVTLQLGKSEIKTARGGQECGMNYKGRVKPEPGDLIEAYDQEKKVRELIIAGISQR